MSDDTLIQDSTPVGEPDSATETTGDTQSVISALREKRRHLGAQAKPLRLAVPGYDDLLLIEYKWVPFAELAKNAQTLARINSPTEVQIAAACDTLIATCQDVLVRVGDEVKPLIEDDTKPLLGFGDPRLPELLGFDPAKSAREACRSVFSNEYALITTANTVIEWLQDTTRRVDQEHLGN